VTPPAAGATWTALQVMAHNLQQLHLLLLLLLLLHVQVTRFRMQGCVCSRKQHLLLQQILSQVLMLCRALPASSLQSSSSNSSNSKYQPSLLARYRQCLKLMVVKTLIGHHLLLTTAVGRVTQHLATATLPSVASGLAQTRMQQQQQCSIVVKLPGVSRAAVGSSQQLLQLLWHAGAAATLHHQGTSTSAETRAGRPWRLCALHLHSLALRCRYHWPTCLSWHHAQGGLDCAAACCYCLL
jgi:hypothetical protein